MENQFKQFLQERDLELRIGSPVLQRHLIVHLPLHKSQTGFLSVDLSNLLEFQGDKEHSLVQHMSVDVNFAHTQTHKKKTSMIKIKK